MKLSAVGCAISDFSGVWETWSLGRVKGLSASKIPCFSQVLFETRLKEGSGTRDWPRRGRLKLRQHFHRLFCALDSRMNWLMEDPDRRPTILPFIPIKFASTRFNNRANYKKFSWASLLMRYSQFAMSKVSTLSLVHFRRRSRAYPVMILFPLGCPNF